MEKLEEEGQKGGQRAARRNLDRAFINSPVLILRHFAIKQHQAWNNDDITQLARVSQYGKSSLTTESGNDVSARLVVAKSERVRLQQVYKWAHELLGYAEVKEVAKATKKHKCCVCKPMQCMRMTAKKKGNFTLRPLTVTEICAGKCLGPFCIAFGYFGHDASGNLTHKRFIRKKFKFFCMQDKIPKSQTEHQRPLALVMRQKRVMRLIFSFIASPWKDMSWAYKERDAQDPWRQTWDPTLNISMNVMGATDTERKRFAFPPNSQNWILASKKHMVIGRYTNPHNLRYIRHQFMGLAITNELPMTRPLWWGLRFLFTLRRETPVVGRLVGANMAGYQVADEDLTWTRRITGLIIYDEGQRGVAITKTLPYRSVMLRPELCPEEDETVNLFPSMENVKFKTLASLAYSSRFAGYPDLNAIRRIYDTEKLGKSLHPDPVLDYNSPIPLSPIGVLWCEHYATPVCVEQKIVTGNVTAEIQFAGLLDHRPKMTTKEFLMHDMCCSARLRYTIRLWVYAYMSNGSVVKTKIAIDKKMKQLGMDEKQFLKFFKGTDLYAGQRQRGGKSSTKIGDAWKRPFYAYYTAIDRVNLMLILTSQLSRFLEHKDYSIHGVSERTFNDTYFKTVPKDKRSMFNDFMLVNSFRKYHNSLTWSITGAKTHMITLQFAGDNGVATPSTTTLDIFKEQHKHDRELVQFVEKWGNCSWEKQGSRVCPVIATECVLDRQEQYTICPSVKGPRHCAQRVIAAALLLTIGAKIENINELLNLPGFKKLGADTDAAEIDEALQSVGVREWLFTMTGVRCRMSLGDKISGDASVRHHLARLPSGNVAVAYPKDYSGAKRHCMLMYRPLECGPVLMWDPSDAIDKDAHLAMYSRKNETSLRIYEYAAIRFVQFDTPFKNKRLSRNLRRKRKRLFRTEETTLLAGT
jgi:hypothetical protein